MKKWITLVILFIAVPLHAKSRRPAPAEDDFTTYQTSGTLTPPQAFLNISSGTLSALLPKSYVFIDQKRKTILKIDQNGDVFLRGKWIGWDWRLTKQYRETGKWTPRETAVPGNQGRSQ